MPDLLSTSDADCKKWFHLLYFSNIRLKSSLVLRSCSCITRTLVQNGFFFLWGGGQEFFWHKTEVYSSLGTS